MNCRCYVTSAIFLVRLSMNLSVGLWASREQQLIAVLPSIRDFQYGTLM
jgi:hypothetical protein